MRVNNDIGSARAPAVAGGRSDEIHQPLTRLAAHCGIVSSMPILRSVSDFIWPRLAW